MWMCSKRPSSRRTKTRSDPKFIHFINYNYNIVTEDFAEALRKLGKELASTH